MASAIAQPSAELPAKSCSIASVARLAVEHALDRALQRGDLVAADRRAAPGAPPGPGSRPG